MDPGWGKAAMVCIDPATLAGYAANRLLQNALKEA
jgi:hypothetical protein